MAVLQAAAQEGDTLLPFSETLTRIGKRFPDRRACRPTATWFAGRPSFTRKCLISRRRTTRPRWR